MRIVTLDQVEFARRFGIDMAAIGELVAADRTGGAGTIAADFGRIAPGGETAPHNHDEAEAFIVLAGQGMVVADGTAHPVGPGAVALFEPFESHVLRNTGDDELHFVDVYWRDAERAVRAAADHGRARLAGRPVFVFSTPPTPNGDLHLGHLSGPYLGADVFVRFQRMNGVEAYHLTGSDDFQSYVVGRARQENRAPEEVAAHYAAEIRATLDLMDVPLDQYTMTNADPAYPEGLRGFFSRLIASGAVERRRDPALFDGESGAYLYEVDVGGLCPVCGSPTGGNICEECGEPNLCVDIVAPRSRLSAAPPRHGSADRYSLPLHRFREMVLDHHRRGKLSPRLRELAARLFRREEFHLPVTHPARWGVSPAAETEGEQVIWVWPEMAYGFLHGIAALGRRLGRDWDAARPRDDWKIVHFFGYDNSFYHTILYPVLYRLAHPGWQPDIDYNVNEFYLLDGQKFSTSRRHAVWGKEILSADSVDAVRYYLALTRGESGRTNFELAAFQSTVERVLIDRWQAWLNDLGRRVAADFDGRAPDAGTWTAEQRAFLDRLQGRLQAIAGGYGADGFALNAVMRELNGLVDDSIRFAEAHRRLSALPEAADDWRTTLALELAAAQLLSDAAAPVMPRFAGRLARCLGAEPASRWPDAVRLIPPGRPVTLAEMSFFTVPELATTGRTPAAAVTA